MTTYSRTIHANGIRQHYLEAGDGPPVVLLHGFPETSYAWRFQIPELAKKYRVIAPDFRGYGESDKPSSGYDKRTMAMDVRELMRALNLPKIALVGHDRGARVATRFAKDIRKPSTVWSLWTMYQPESLVENSTLQKQRGIGFFYFT